MDLKEINELRKQGRTLFAKNTTRSTITANDDKGRFELGPVGSDEAIKPIPSDRLDMPGVQTLIRSGSIVVGDESLYDTVTSSSTSPKAETVAEANGLVVEIEENRSRRDLVKKTCLITGKNVFQTQEEVEGEVPPLDKSVAHRAHEFVVRHVPLADGSYEVTWDHVQIGEKNGTS